MKILENNFVLIIQQFLIYFSEIFMKTLKKKVYAALPVSSGIEHASSILIELGALNCLLIIKPHYHKTN